MKKAITLVLLSTILFIYEVNAVKIVTVFEPEGASCLSQKAAAIPMTTEGLQEAKIITEQLIETLKPLMPAAGLAAPQIGISKQVFIYSWDRTIENIEVAINPKIIQADTDTYTSWEACFSTIQENGTSQAALVTRAKKLEVEYYNLEGKIVRKKLDGFAAKVFQHEYDHLQGVENIRKDGAEVKTFPNQQELNNFMQSVKKGDALTYIKPLTME